MILGREVGGIEGCIGICGNRGIGGGVWGRCSGGVGICGGG